MKMFSLFPLQAVVAVALYSSVGMGQNIAMDTETENVEDADFSAQVSDNTAGHRRVEVPTLFQDSSEYSDSAEHELSELGINNYTAPSIRKIFEQLEGLPAVPEEKVLRERPEKLPTDRCSLGLEMGFLLADGFIAVQNGKMNDIKPIALDLSRFGKAMGVGERVNAHAASLLENAEKGQLEEFKNNLAVTQNDVNAELASLRDSEIAHIIALGGWIRALDASCAALKAKFTAEQARTVFYPDAPEYFDEILSCISPEMNKRRNIGHIRTLLQKLAEEMTLNENEEPSPKKIASIYAITEELVRVAMGEDVK